MPQDITPQAFVTSRRIRAARKGLDVPVAKLWAPGVSAASTESETFLIIKKGHDLGEGPGEGRPVALSARLEAQAYRLE